ncbi:hypothetical protein LX36DRAFT_672694 [Colletotrichum falcatum]|nr:hypothetical protein LX36DRAFT_672694 [Colletotrichum falcatum]
MTMCTFFFLFSFSFFSFFFFFGVAEYEELGSAVVMRVAGIKHTAPGAAMDWPERYKAYAGRLSSGRAYVVCVCLRPRSRCKALDRIKACPVPHGQRTQQWPGSKQ